MAYAIQNIELVGMAVLEGICTRRYLGHNFEPTLASVKMRHEPEKLAIDGGATIVERKL
jgi:hypothetical protein